jgi:hypothetical protein
VNLPTWTDTQVASGQSFTYRVTAQIQNGICQTPYSNERLVNVPYQIFLGLVSKQ